MNKYEIWKNEARVTSSIFTVLNKYEIWKNEARVTSSIFTVLNQYEIWKNEARVIIFNLHWFQKFSNYCLVLFYWNIIHTKTGNDDPNHFFYFDPTQTKCDKLRAYKENCLNSIDMPIDWSQQLHNCFIVKVHYLWNILEKMHGDTQFLQCHCR